MNSLGRRYALILFALATVLALVWLTVGRRASTSVPERELKTPAQVETPDSSEREVFALETPQTEAVDVPAAIDAKAAARETLAAAEAICREKYREFTKDQLVLAKYDLDRKVKSDRDRITKEILASPDMDLSVPSSGETLPDLSTSAESPVVSFVSVIGVGPVGNALSKRREIDAKTYPDFHALTLEQWWVDGELRRLEKIGK